MNRIDRLNDIQKSQAIRALDVMLIGPLMLLGGWELQRSGDRWSGGLLEFFGFSTIVYNARNWYRAELDMAMDDTLSMLDQVEERLDSIGRSATRGGPIRSGVGSGVILLVVAALGTWLWMKERELR